MPSVARARSLANRLLATLPPTRADLFNAYQSRCAHDDFDDAPRQRLERLVCHLNRDPLVCLVGEAGGWAGYRYSGIAFTSEKLLLDDAIPGVPAPAGRLTTRRLPFCEPSATIVWRTLYELKIETRAILWNSLAVHPHRPDTPLSNRTPRPAEIEAGVPALRLLLEAFPKARFVAVGAKAVAGLKAAGATPAHVRHPAYGGAPEFAAGLRALIR